MKWFDLEALGWMIKKFDDRTRRYTYQAPARNGFRQTIDRRSDLKPGDKKYADILYPKVTRPAPAGQLMGRGGPQPAGGRRGRRPRAGAGAGGDGAGAGRRGGDRRH
jgi:hypothetical protein